jgi:hypothetical protein
MTVQLMLDLDADAGKLVLHRPCGGVWEVATDGFYDEAWDDLGKPCCRSCLEEHGAPVAFGRWELAQSGRVEDRFPDLFASGFSKVPDQLWDLGHQVLGLESRELLVVGALWRHQSRGGRAYPPAGQVAGETGLGEKTVRRAVEALEARGLLAVRRTRGRGGRQLANEYDLAPLWAALTVAPDGRGDLRSAGRGDHRTGGRGDQPGRARQQVEQGAGRRR